MPETDAPRPEEERPPFGATTWRQRLDLLTAAPPASPVRLAGAAVLVVGVLVVLAVTVWPGGPGPAPELSLPLAGSARDPAAATTTTTTTTEVLAHAAGTVQRPGVYRLAAGARASDLLDAAGGPAPGADLDRLNLAAPLVDGQRVYVPVEGEVIPAVEGGGVAGSEGDSPPGKVNLNTATAEQLEALPGVGPVTSQAILDERDRRGRFSSVEQLIDVRGIGDAKLAQLRDLVSV